MQENEVEIRGVAELHATELAVADGADAHGTPLCARTAHRRTKLRAHLLPAELQRLLHDELGYVSEAIAHLHERQPATQVRHGDAEDGGALEGTQRLDLTLRIIVPHLLHDELEIAREIRPLGQLREQALINKLIEQQRIGGNLL